MDAETLREQWHSNNDRPAWVLEHSDLIAEYVSTSEPIPDPDAGMHAMRKWLESYKPTVTRQLNEAAGDVADVDESDADNGGGE